MLVLVGIKVSQFGGIARKMTWFQVSVCHSLQFPWHFVCETWCQRFVAGGVRATRRDLKLRTKMFWYFVDMSIYVDVFMSIGLSGCCWKNRHLHTVQSRPPDPGLREAFCSPAPSSRHARRILSCLWKEKIQLLGERTSQDKKVEIQRFPAAFPILCLHDANGCKWPHQPSRIFRTTFSCFVPFNWGGCLFAWKFIQPFGSLQSSASFSISWSKSCLAVAMPKQ